MHHCFGKIQRFGNCFKFGGKEGRTFSFETKVLNLTVIMLSTKVANRERIVALRGNWMDGYDLIVRGYIEEKALQKVFAR